MSELDLDELAAATYSAVFSDICDQLGYRSQTADPRIVRQSGTGTLVGWARTFESLPVDQPPARHYGGEIDFIDSLQPGEVAVGDCSTRPAAAWGELFSTAALGRGARGAVIDGIVRDADAINDLGFPVFATGRRPTDSLGRVSLTHVDRGIDLAGVPVSPGDLIVADSDGVTVVPSEIVGEAVRRARKKAETETNARHLLLEGGLLADVWERYRVL